MTRIYSFLLLIFLSLAVAFAIMGSNNTKEKKLNVIWIVIDALRADHLGCYGYTRQTSPFIDEFANKSILFKYAFSQESYTMASVASYFTSTYPWINKVLYDDEPIDTLAPRFITIAEILKKANYNTAAFVFNFHLKSEYNFDQGFDIYDDNKAGFDNSLPENEAFETAKKIFDRVKYFLENTKNKKPVFLYLHYRDVHAPYAPPPPYDAIFPVPEPPAPIKGKKPLSENIQYKMAMYDGEIRYADDNIKNIFGLLAKHNITSENSLFIITADHGDEFHDTHPNDKGGWGHGRTLYNELIHVPLILSIPSISPQERIISTYVGLIDLVPTILDTLNIDGVKYHQFQGKSLLPLINGMENNSSIVFGGGKLGRGFVIADGYKYYIHKQRTVIGNARPTNNDFAIPMQEELYDLKTDFRETTDLLTKEPAIALKLKKKLELLMKNPY